jgi:hypothetical protein
LHQLSGSGAWWWWWILSFSLAVIMPIVGGTFMVDLESELKKLFLSESQTAHHSHSSWQPIPSLVISLFNLTTGCIPQADVEGLQ